MKSPEMSSQEKKKDSPVSRVESNPRVDQLKKDLKFSFWDFQAKNGTNASVVDFAKDPSFQACLNNAKQSGLSMEEMGAAVDFIRNTYGKKVIAQQDRVADSTLEEKYVVNNDTEPKYDDKEDTRRTKSKNSKPEQNDNFLKDFRANLDRITAEADARDEEERKRIENERVEADRVLLEKQKQLVETREREGLDREASLLRDIEKKKQVESFVKNVEKEFSSLADKFFVKMRQDQYEKANIPVDQVERYANYMNDVYLDVRNFKPSGDDLQFSIRDNTLVCTAGRSIEGISLASFDLKDLDDNSRTQVLLDIKNKWGTFVSSSRK